MQYVDNFDLFGSKVKQIPCIPAKGAPTATTAGAVGLLYMNTDNGNLYKCTAAADGVYTWVFIGGDGGGSADGAVLYTPQTLSKEQQEQARDNIGAASASAIGDISTALDELHAYAESLKGGDSV